ncbi:hypothetical protein LP420_11480 [Massilia sp. B-10]|nr:hypothetical protein LP420_11480 [Massilia sp. B-10]
MPRLASKVQSSRARAFHYTTFGSEGPALRVQAAARFEHGAQRDVEPQAAARRGLGQFDFQARPQFEQRAQVGHPGARGHVVGTG